MPTKERSETSTALLTEEASSPMALEEPTRQVRQEDVARRAYEIFQARGEEPGRDLDDWLQAARQLMEEV